MMPAPAQRKLVAPERRATGVPFYPVYHERPLLGALYMIETSAYAWLIGKQVILNDILFGVQHQTMIVSVTLVTPIQVGARRTSRINLAFNTLTFQRSGATDDLFY
jgi:hypothetical protein